METNLIIMIFMNVYVCPILKSVITLYETFVIQVGIGAMHYWISTIF